jgi:hypothetical protein
MKLFSAPFVAAALGFLLTGAPAVVDAGQCRGCPFPCGRVENNSNVWMQWAELGVGSSTCAIWGPGGATTSRCIIRALAPRSSVGGCSARIDVDAFRFTDRDYVYRRGLSTTNVRRGVWTKITDLQTTRCSLGYCSG